MALRHTRLYALSIALVIPGVVTAQRAVHIGAAATAATPVGEFSNAYATGLGGLVTLAYGNDNFPIGLRIDVANARAQGRAVAGVKSDAINLTSVSANLIGTAAVASLKPYLIGGAGWYPYRETEDAKRKSHLGINGGVGVTVPFPMLGALFLESRYHRIYGRTATKRYVSTSLGIVL